jgi:carotenoid cleavage dioxygenase-like enzyme
MFKRHNTIVKLDFDAEDPEDQTLEYELPNGEFGSEPLFVTLSEDGDEDDGVIIMSGIDANSEKAFILILNAKNMKPEYKGLAPELGLFGVHSEFYPYNVGCSKDSCMPMIQSSAHTRITISLLMLFMAIILAFDY